MIGKKTIGVLHSFACNYVKYANRRVFAETVTLIIVNFNFVHPGSITMTTI